MKDIDFDDKIIKKVFSALCKKAKGYETKEITEEYAKDGNKEVLVKKKINKFYVPADISASKLLFEMFAKNSQEKSFSNMSDEEMDKEAVKIFAEYQALSGKDLISLVKGEKIEDC